MPSPRPVRLSLAQQQEHMRHALALAQQALPHGDVPVGALLLCPQGQVVATGFNTREQHHNPLGHAELNVLAQAASTLGQWRLQGHTLVVTLEPCAMCASALAQARVSTVVFGAWDAEQGGCGSWVAAHTKPRAVHCQGGVLEAECRQLLQACYSQTRQR